MTQIEIAAVKIRQALNNAFPHGKKSLFTSAVITAAGKGERMGGISKQLLELNGKPCLIYSLKVFQTCRQIDEIVVSARPDEIPIVQKLVKQYGITKVSAVVPGGKTRQESVKNGFLAISTRADLVAIHDGDRPLLAEEDLVTILTAAARYGAASAAKPITDSLKRGDENGFIRETVSRENLYAVETPQIFLTDLYRVSLALAEKNGVEATDDNALAEHAGFKVKLCMTKGENIKLTLPEDKSRIERILKERA